MQIPKFLHSGSTILILAPAKAIDINAVSFSKDFLESQGFKVVISEHCLGKNNYFSGSIEERKSDFQKAINNPNIDAVLCARGGYGCVHFIDDLDWASFLQEPKWIVGFSDITVIHQKLQTLGVASLHATMPLNFESNTKEALASLVNALLGEKIEYEYKTTTDQIVGEATGRIIGGNLSILYSTIGTNDFPNFSGAILYFEDLGEHIYQLDRMFFALKKSGVFDVIKGVIVGSLTNIKDTEDPFGLSVNDIIRNHFKSFNIPVCFDFPAGHINDNRALMLGTNIKLSVSKSSTHLCFTMI